MGIDRWGETKLRCVSIPTELIGMAVLAGVISSGCQAGGTASESAKNAAPPPAAQVAASTPNPVDRGRYLVTTGGCSDCHTPLKMGPNGPEPDMSLELAGHPEALKMPPAPSLPAGPWLWVGAATNTAFAGPWGVTFSANLTSDANTGLGIWSEDLFVKAMRTGKHFGTARPIMPPMPWMGYAKMTGDDLKAMFAYLKTVKPVKNHVPDYLPPATGH